MSESRTIEYEGLKFRVEIHHDNTSEAPWQDSDCHGPVSGWTTRDKRPGERVLNQDGPHLRYYDVAGAIAKAKAEDWGLNGASLSELRKRLGREPSKKEIRAEAVERDFDFLRRWCNNEWHYVGVGVTLLFTNGEETHLSDSLWGIESDATEYLEEVAAGLAESIAQQVGNTATLPRVNTIRSAAEAPPQLH